MSGGSLWQRLTSWLRGQSDVPLLAEPAPGEVAPPVHLRAEEEMWLEALISDVGEGERLWAIGDNDFWQRIGALWSRGHQRLAIEWLEKFIAAPTTPTNQGLALRVKLVELCDEASDLATARAHLEVLVDHDEHALRSHYLLAEHAQRRGDEIAALRHYEAVLARDMNHPNVRARVDRLRALRGPVGPASVGETIAGGDALGITSGVRYRLIREIGRGATGAVYLARDIELERDVAVKLLHPHLAAISRAQACARFFAEARLAASLRHPNIIAVLDLDERTRRVVMELAAGGTLRALLAEHGPRPPRQALERHTQILSALAAAHRRSIVHCDLKPGNLMFRRDPAEPGVEIVLGDFGVAHLSDATAGSGNAEPRARKPAEAMGTLAYMAPEQRRGENSDPRVDLYAAAVVLYEMLTGRHPFSQAAVLSGARARGDFHLPDTVLRGVAPDTAAYLQDHLDRLGEPDPARRPDTRTALAEARELRDLAIADGGLVGLPDRGRTAYPDPP